MAKKLIQLNVQERTHSGKGHNRRLRASGFIPGIYYDQHGANIMVKLEELPLVKAYEKIGGGRVFELAIERTDGKKEALPSLIWRMKYDPVRPRPIHVDFFGVDLDKELKVSVPFEVTGTAKGAAEGGVIDLVRDTIEVICKPLDIPESIVLDATNLDVNDSIQIEDVEFPEGVTPLFDENYSILTCTVPQMVEEEESIGEEEEGAEGEEEGEESEASSEE